MWWLCEIEAWMLLIDCLIDWLIDLGFTTTTCDWSVQDDQGNVGGENKGDNKEFFITEKKIIIHLHIYLLKNDDEYINNTFIWVFN